MAIFLRKKTRIVFYTSLYVYKYSRNKNIISYFIFFFLLNCWGTAFSQSKMMNAFVESESVWNTDKENYLRPIQCLKQMDLDSLSPLETNIYFDALATFSSFTSDFEETLRCDILRKRKYKTNNFIIEDSSFLNSEIFPAKEEILKLAKENEVIMINESHHTPYHRNIVNHLLEGFLNEKAV